jgi:hypothetical protein
MKRSFVLMAMVATCGFIACNTEGPSTPPPVDTTDTLRFEAKEGFVARYDEYPVDTAGIYFDKPKLDEKKEVQEVVVDTGLTYEGAVGVSRHIAPGSKFDTSYFYQDASGDLYRYNYGFKLLSIPVLEPYFERPVDMKWVLLMRFSKSEGATWLAKRDSINIPAFGTKVYFESNATMKADTTIRVGSEDIACRQVEHVITATAKLNNIPVNGRIVARCYVSAKYGKVILDFIRSGTISGGANAKVQGIFKIMTFHE